MALSWGGFSQLDVDGSKLCFVRVQDKSVARLTDGSIKAICGKVDHDKALVDEGIIIPIFNVLFQPTPEELDVLLPWIGYTQSPADTFTPVDTMAANSAAVVLDRVGSVDDFGNAYVTKAILRGQKGVQPLSLEIEAVCDQYPDIGGTTFTGVAPTITAPYPFHRGVLTLEGSAREFQSFVFIHDNHLIFQHNNSRTPQHFEIGEDGRTFHLGVDTPYTSSELALLNNPIAGVSGAAGSLVFTRATQSTSIAFTNLKAEPNPPDVAKEEVRLQTYYKAYANGSTKPVIITHDATV